MEFSEQLPATTKSARDTCVAAMPRRVVRGCFYSAFDILQDFASAVMTNWHWNGDC